MVCTKSVSRFSFNLAPRTVHVATRVVRVAAMRCHSNERCRYTLLPITRRGAEKIESISVHNAMYKNVPRFSFNLAPRIVRVVTRVVRVAAVRRHATERCRYTLLALALRGTKKNETKIVHNVMYKERL